MTILEFLRKFPDNDSCKLHFRLQREQQGVICKHCGCAKHYWLQKKWQWQCSACGFRTTLRSGTIMENFYALSFLERKRRTILNFHVIAMNFNDGVVWLLTHKNLRVVYSGATS